MAIPRKLLVAGSFGGGGLESESLSVWKREKAEREREREIDEMVN